MNQYKDEPDWLQSGTFYKRTHPVFFSRGTPIIELITLKEPNYVYSLEYGETYSNWSSFCAYSSTDLSLKESRHLTPFPLSYQDHLDLCGVNNMGSIYLYAIFISLTYFGTEPLTFLISMKMNTDEVSIIISAI